MFFNRHLGIHQPTPRIARGGQKSDPVVHVTEIGVVTELQLARNATLLLPELRRQSVENRIPDLVIEAIDVNLLHPLAKALSFLLKAADDRIVVAPHRRQALTKCVRQPLEYLVRD